MGFVVTFDIESIPLEDSELSAVQLSEKERKAENYLKLLTNNATKQEALDLIGGTSPIFGRIAVLGIDLFNDATNVHKSFSLTAATLADEKELLINFYSLLGQIPSRAATYVHYNGLNFDVPFILRRSMYWNVPVAVNAFLQVKKFSPKPHFDVKEWLSNWNNMNSITLELACDFFGIASPKEGEVKASGVYKAFKEGKLAEIAEYCMRDVKATFELYMKLKDYVY